MADPVVTACPADTWVKVATNVTTLTPRVLSLAPNLYGWTYRDTTGVAPTDIAEMVPLDSGVTLNFGTGADVYLRAVGNDGSVRIDR